MLSSVLDALLGQVPFVPVITVLDALPAVLILWYAGWTVTEAVRVRDGSISRNMVLWPSKKGVKGTHEEFVARYRRRLTVSLASSGCCSWRCLSWLGVSWRSGAEASWTRRGQRQHSALTERQRAVSPPVPAVAHSKCSPTGRRPAAGENMTSDRPRSRSSLHTSNGSVRFSSLLRRQLESPLARGLRGCLTVIPVWLFSRMVAIARCRAGPVPGDLPFLGCMAGLNESSRDLPVKPRIRFRRIRLVSAGLRRMSSKQLVACRERWLLSPGHRELAAGEGERCLPRRAPCPCSRSRGISPEIRMTSGFCAYEFFAIGFRCRSAVRAR